jgi:hypothetical protein
MPCDAARSAPRVSWAGGHLRGAHRCGAGQPAGRDGGAAQIAQCSARFFALLCRAAAVGASPPASTLLRPSSQLRLPLPAVCCGAQVEVSPDGGWRPASSGGRFFGLDEHDPLGSPAEAAAAGLAARGGRAGQRDSDSEEVSGGSLQRGARQGFVQVELGMGGGRVGVCVCVVGRVEVRLRGRCAGVAAGGGRGHGAAPRGGGGAVGHEAQAAALARRD